MSYKAIAVAHELADALKKRLPFLIAPTTLVEAFDANGDAVIAIGDSTPVTTEKNVFIRVKAIDWSLSKNIIGQPSEVFTPTVIQVATEAVAINGSYLLPGEQLALLGTVLSRGTRVEWWQETNGTVPSVTTFNTPAKLKATYEASLYWTMKASQ